MPRKPAKFGPKAFKSRALRADVARMLNAGWKPPRIGQELGFSRQRAHQLAKEVLADLSVQYSTDLSGARAQELARLDALWSAHWGKGAELGHAAILIKVSEARRAILGLDCPPEMRMPPPDPTPQTDYDLSLIPTDELIAMRATLAKAKRPALTQDQPPLLEQDERDDDDNDDDKEDAA